MAARGRRIVLVAPTGRRRRDPGALAPIALAAIGFVGGVAVGSAVWSRLLDVNRRGLFSHHPVRRFAAISYLGARPSVDTVRLLKDYIAWEPHPLLRRRARRVLRAVEQNLEQRHGP